MDAFISHTSENSKLAISIEKFLEEKNLNIWLDHSDIRLGVLLRNELQSEIRKSRTLILLWSESASTSRWVASEILMAFHLDRFIIPCVLDNKPLPQFLRNTVFLDMRHDEEIALNRLMKAVRDAPEAANKLPPVIGSQSPQLKEIINSINNGQMKELDLIGKHDLKQATEVHNLVNEVLEQAEKHWRLDPEIVNLFGYHHKNAYMLKHWDAIQAGRPPKDSLLEQAENFFFEALYVNPNDLSAINGLGSVLFYELELDAAEFFVRKAIAMAKKKDMSYAAAEHDLAMIKYTKNRIGQSEIYPKECRK